LNLGISFGRNLRETNFKMAGFQGLMCPELAYMYIHVKLFSFWIVSCHTRAGICSVVERAKLLQL
jgi:hypothetical protein